MRYLEVFWRFLVLGCMSFGGPVAHLGYFRALFVERLGWLDEAAYGQLVALSQFLPGPSSSQVGFAIGVHRAGFWGGVGAFVGFTAPSFGLLYLLAQYEGQLNTFAWMGGAIQGLKLFAVVVVADAVLGMARTFCKTRLSVVLALATALGLALVGSIQTQLAFLAGSALVAWLASFKTPSLSGASGPIVRPNLLLLGLFLGCFVLVPWLASQGGFSKIFSDFYYAGSLVFGGGHVVLPLLGEVVGDTLSKEQFLTGYAAAQAVPGPMFSLAAYLGGALGGEKVFLGALVATLGIFLPGFLLIGAFGGAWHALAKHPRVASAIAGVNASVVGMLGFAFYDPVLTSAITGIPSVAGAVVGWLLLKSKKIPLALLALLFVAGGVVAVYM